MNDKDFGSIKLLKLKYGRGGGGGGGTNNSNFLQNCFPAEIRSLLFNFHKLEKSEEILLNHTECIKV